MITFDESAAAAVKKILSDEKLSEDTRLRIKVVGGGCSGFAYDLAFDEITETNENGEPIVRAALKNEPIGAIDKLFESNGVTFVVDSMSCMYLMGTTISYVETLAATGFKFQNPNVSSSCGCGNSVAF